VFALSCGGLFSKNGSHLPSISRVQAPLVIFPGRMKAVSYFMVTPGAAFPILRDMPLVGWSFHRLVVGRREVPLVAITSLLFSATPFRQGITYAR